MKFSGFCGIIMTSLLINFSKAFQLKLPTKTLIFTGARQSVTGLVLCVSNDPRVKPEQKKFWSEEELSKMKVVELKKACKFRGIKADGKKQDLIDRLMSVSDLSLEAINRKPVTKTRSRAMLEEIEAENEQEQVEPIVQKPKRQQERPAAKNAKRRSEEMWFVLQFDGGSRGNPGLAGAGYSLAKIDKKCPLDDPSPECRQEVYFGHHYLGDESTNNEAEYEGLIQGLQAANMLGIKNLLVEGDSNLIVQQLSGKFKVKSPNLRAMYAESQQLSKKFDNFRIRHIERALNSRADELANMAMDSKSNDAQTVLLKKKR